MICNKRTVLFFRHEKDYSLYTILLPEGKLNSLSLRPSLPSIPFPSFIEIDNSRKFYISYRHACGSFFQFRDVKEVK